MHKLYYKYMYLEGLYSFITLEKVFNVNTSTFHFLKIFGVLFGKEQFKHF